MDALLLSTNRSAACVSKLNVSAETEYVADAGSRTQFHCALNALLNSSERVEISVPGRSGGRRLTRYLASIPGCATGAGCGVSDAHKPPRTVGQPSTQSSASSNTGRFVKPVALAKEGSFRST